jgi:hypothetical protein
MKEILTMIEEKWLELEEEAGESNESWRLRLALPLADLCLFVAVHGGKRYLLLRTRREEIPPRSGWPSCVGLELLAVKLEEYDYFGVVLRENRFRDVFAALAEDLAHRISSVPNDQSVSIFVGQLARWQSFLAAATEGLGHEARRGLWGELHFLLEVLLPAIGGSATIGWKGPEKAHQDFQFPSAWIEVKTTLASQPQTVRINSERQLDNTRGPELYLHVIALDAVAGGEYTLPELVRRVRSLLVRWPYYREQFETSLIEAGYLDIHASRYGGLGYAVRCQRTFHVSKTFPRIVENDLRYGVGDISYRLSLASCESFGVPISKLIASITNKEPNR